MSDRLVSPSGRVSLNIQDDGGVVLYHDGVPVWQASDQRLPGPAPEPPAPPPSGDVPLPPIRGQLHCDEQSYLDDSGRRVPVFVHAGDLLMLFVEARLAGDAEKNTRVHQAFLDIQRAGYSGLRSWWSICWLQSHPFWRGRSLNPSDREHRRLIRECLRIGAEDYGLRWHIALGDALHVPTSQMDDAWIWMSGVVHANPEWFGLVEGLNEAYGTGQSDPREVQRWVDISREQNPETLHVLSAAAGANGSENPDELRLWTPDNQRIWYVHADRAGHWGDQTRHAFSSGYHVPPRRLGWSGEPPGINWGPHQLVSVMDYPDEWTERPWRYAFYLAVTALARAVPTYFCSHGVMLEGRFRDAPGFVEAPRLISALPADVMAYEDLFHGGDTHQSRRVVEAPPHCRADHAMKPTGESVIAIYPERPDITTATLRFDRGWTGRIHDEWGSSDVVMGQGEHLSRDISSGILLVGTAT